MRGYRHLVGFESVYLEDSWVLGVEATLGQLRIEMEFVLHEGHPAYAPPKAGEHYCYRRGTIWFDGVTELTWLEQLRARPATDASGESDLGHIDEFETLTDSYRLLGDFGVVAIQTSAAPRVLLEDQG